MKKISIFLIGLLLISLVSAFSINKGANIYFNCNNGTSGVNLGTVANISCWDSSGTKDLNTIGMTNLDIGIFNYTFWNLTEDTYTCFINCSAGCVDYIVPIEVGRVSQNNLTDGIIRSSVIETGLSSNASNIIAQNAIVTTNLGTNISNMIIPNTTKITTNISNVNDRVIDILADTNELQTNQNWDVWNDGTRTLTTADWTTDSDLTNVCYKSDISSLEINVSGAITSNRTRLQTDLLNTNQSIQAKLTEILAGMIINTSNINAYILTSFTANTSAINTNVDAVEVVITNLGTNISNMIIANKTGTATDILNTNQSIQGKLDKVLANQTILNNSIGAISASSCPTVAQIDTQLNLSHSEGNWSNVGTCPTLAEIDTRINSSHGEGLYNTTTSASGFATPADIVSATTNLSGAISGNTSLINTNIDAVEITISNLGTNVSNMIIANVSFLNIEINNVSQQVWVYTIRGLTDEDINSSLYCVNNLDKTGYTLSVQDWTTDSDLTNIAIKSDISNLGTNISNMIITNVSYLETEINNVSNQVWIYTVRSLTDENINSSLYCVNNLDTSLATQIGLTNLGTNISQMIIANATNYSRIATSENITDVKNIATNVLNNQSILKTTIDNILNNQTIIYDKIANIWSEATRTLTSFNFLVGLNATGISDIWSSATRNLTAFDFRVRLNATGIEDVTSNITADHGTGLYNISSVISDSDKSDIARKVWNDSIVSQENRTVASNVSASISESDKKEIGQYVVQYEYNRTETFYNNSLGYPTNTTVKWTIDNRTANITYKYYPDNITIKNASYKN